MALSVRSAFFLFLCLVGTAQGLRLDEDPAAEQGAVEGEQAAGNETAEEGEDAGAEAEAADILTKRKEDTIDAAKAAAGHVSGTEQLAGEVKAHAIQKTSRATVHHKKASGEHEESLEAAVKHDLRVERLTNRHNQTKQQLELNKAFERELELKAEGAKYREEAAMEHAVAEAQKTETHLAEFNAADEVTSAAGDAKKAADEKLKGATEASESACSKSAHAHHNSQRMDAMFNTRLEEAEKDKAKYKEALEESTEANKVLDEKKKAEKLALEAADEATGLAKSTARKKAEAALNKKSKDEDVEATAADLATVKWAAGAVKADAKEAEGVHAKHESQLSEDNEEADEMSDELKGVLRMEKIAQGDGGGEDQPQVEEAQAEQ